VALIAGPVITQPPFVEPDCHDLFQPIFQHNHLCRASLALTNTFVVQGEHRLYEPNGALKEIRPVGSYTSSQPGEPHREGGGDQECVVFYSVRGKTDVLLELLNDNRNIVGTLTTRDFMEALEEQKKVA
jgi:hypothetical protein